ncbi:MAG TPA: hypothetical protein VIP77_02755 [Jiangellaceae bacterium]
MTPQQIDTWANAADWAATNWPNLATAALLATAACVIWQALRTAGRKVDAALAEINQPESRKEDRP